MKNEARTSHYRRLIFRGFPPPAYFLFYVYEKKWTSVDILREKGLLYSNHLRILLLELSMSFYFVSEAPKFKNLIFFHFFVSQYFLSFFSNLHILAVLTMFLQRRGGLLFIFDMMIFHSGNLSSFRIFIKSSDFYTKWMVYFSYLIWFSILEIYPISGFSSIFS